MAVPIVFLYYGLMIMVSIFLYNYVDEQLLIEGKNKLVETIGDENTLFKEQATKLKEMVYPYIQEYIETPVSHMLNEINHKDVVPEVSHYAITIKALSYFKKFLATETGKRITFIYNKLAAFISQILTDYPQISEGATFLWNNLHNNAEVVYGHISTAFVYITETEPIKSLISEYAKIHDKYVTPYINESSEIVPDFFHKYLDKVCQIIFNDNSNDTKYTFLVLVVGVFFFKFFLTKLLRIFAKDAFQMNKNVSDMYKQVQLDELTNQTGQHSDVYLDVKKYSVSDLVVDELDPASNRTIGEQSGSNRTKEEDSGSNRNTIIQQEIKREEEQQQQPQVIDTPPRNINKGVANNTLTADSIKINSSPTPSTISVKSTTSTKSTRLVFIPGKDTIESIDEEAILKTEILTSSPTTTISM